MDDVQYLRQCYGPFQVIRVLPTTGEKCSFCSKKLKKFLQVFSEKKPDLFLECCRECSIDLLGKQRSDEAWASVIGVGLVKCKASPDDPKLREKIKEALEEDIIDTRVLVRKAKKFYEAGFGRKWRAIPSIIRWHEEKGFCTDGQRKVLKAFIGSCKKDA